MGESQQSKLRFYKRLCLKSTSYLIQGEHSALGALFSTDQYEFRPALFPSLLLQKLEWLVREYLIQGEYAQLNLHAYVLGHESIERGLGLSPENGGQK